MDSPEQTEVNDELLPCPFCWGEAKIGQRQIGGTGSSGMEAPLLTIGCPSCDFWFPTQRTEEWIQGKGYKSIFKKANESLIKSWNTRPSPSPIDRNALAIVLNRALNGQNWDESLIHIRQAVGMIEQEGE